MTDWLSKYNGNVCGCWKTINFKTSSKTSKNQISERSRTGCCSKSPWPHCHKSMLVRTTAEEQRVVSKNATNSSMLKFARMNATQNVVVSLLTSSFRNHLHRGKQSICFQIKTFLTGDLKMCSSATLHSNAKSFKFNINLHYPQFFFCFCFAVGMLSETKKEDYCLNVQFYLLLTIWTILCNLFHANALQTCSFAVRNWDISSESNTN